MEPEAKQTTSLETVSDHIIDLGPFSRENSREWSRHNSREWTRHHSLDWSRHEARSRHQSRLGSRNPSLELIIEEPSQENERTPRASPTPIYEQTPPDTPASTNTELYYTRADQSGSEMNWIDIPIPLFEEDASCMISQKPELSQEEMASFWLSSGGCLMSPIASVEITPRSGEEVAPPLHLFVSDDGEYSQDLWC